MASETFQKRQKAVARREKQNKKIARRMERRNEKAKTVSEPEGEIPQTDEIVHRHGPTIL
jgi:hypothetical protein